MVMRSQLIEKYYPELPEERVSMLHSLADLYMKWNKSINVISRKDIDNVFDNHILHSLCIARFIPFSSNSKIMDLGTGGGLPGLPLAIYYPDCHFTLVDSRSKKLKVVEEIVKALQLENVEIIHARAEELELKFHYVVTRAVAPISKLIAWTKNNYIRNEPSGLICLKGGDLREEIDLAPFRSKYKMYDLDFMTELSFYQEKKLLFIPFPFR